MKEDAPEIMYNRLKTVEEVYRSRIAFGVPFSLASPLGKQHEA